MDVDADLYPGGAKVDDKLKSALARLSGGKEEEFLKTSFILVKLLQNIISYPEDERFRTIRRVSSILAEPGSLETLQCAGFAPDSKSPGENLTCPQKADLSRLRLVKQCLLWERQKHASLEGLEIPVTSLRFGERLGKGRFGEVYIGTWDGVPVAVKTLRPNCEQHIVQSFHREASIMRRLQHSNILPLRAVALMVEPCFLVMELMSAPFLAQLNDGMINTVKLQLSRVLEVAQGMEFMHAKNIIHCDLAARNILIDRKGELRIADFGLARECESGSCPASVNDRVFPIRWTSPEVLATGQRSKPADIWSFGILFFEFTTAGSVPYSSFTNPETKEKVKEGYRLPCPVDCPEDVYTIMRKCWHAVPDNRPVFSNIVSDLKKLQPKYKSQGDGRAAPSRGSSFGSVASADAGDLPSGKLSKPKKDKEKDSKLKKRFTFAKADQAKVKVDQLVRLYTLFVTPFETYTIFQVKKKHRASDLVASALKYLGKSSDDVSQYSLVEVKLNLSGEFDSRFIASHENPLAIKATWNKPGKFLLCCSMGNTEILQAINGFLKKSENITRMSEATRGYILKFDEYVEGAKSVGRRKRSNWPRFWAVLDGSTVLLYKDEEDEENGEEPVSHIALKNAQALPALDFSKKRDVIRIISPKDSTYLLHVSSKGDVLKWLEAFNSAQTAEPSALLDKFGDGEVVQSGYLSATKSSLPASDAEVPVEVGRQWFVLKGRQLIYFLRGNRVEALDFASCTGVSVMNPTANPAIAACAGGTPKALSRLEAEQQSEEKLLLYAIRVDSATTRYVLQPDTPGDLDAWVEALDKLLLRIGKSNLMVPVVDFGSGASGGDSDSGVFGMTTDIHRLSEVREEDDADVKEDGATGTDDPTAAGNRHGSANTLTVAGGGLGLGATRLSIRQKQQKGFTAMARLNNRVADETVHYLDAAMDNVSPLQPSPMSYDISKSGADEKAACLRDAPQVELPGNALRPGVSPKPGASPQIPPKPKLSPRPSPVPSRHPAALVLTPDAAALPMPSDRLSPLPHKPTPASPMSSTAGPGTATGPSLAQAAPGKVEREDSDGMYIVPNNPKRPLIAESDSLDDPTYEVTQATPIKDPVLESLAEDINERASPKLPPRPTKTLDRSISPVPRSPSPHSPKLPPRPTDQGAQAAGIQPLETIQAEDKYPDENPYEVGGQTPSDSKDLLSSSGYLKAVIAEEPLAEDDELYADADDMARRRVEPFRPVATAPAGSNSTTARRSPQPQTSEMALPPVGYVVSDKSFKSTATASPAKGHIAKAFSNLPSVPPPSGSPNMRRPSLAASPNVRRPSPAASPNVRRPSPAASPNVRRPSPAASPNLKQKPPPPLTLPPPQDEYDDSALYLAPADVQEQPKRVQPPPPPFPPPPDLPAEDDGDLMADADNVLAAVELRRPSEHIYDCGEMEELQRRAAEVAAAAAAGDIYTMPEGQENTVAATQEELYENLAVRQQQQQPQAPLPGISEHSEDHAGPKSPAGLAAAQQQHDTMAAMSSGHAQEEDIYEAAADILAPDDAPPLPPDDDDLPPPPLPPDCSESELPGVPSSRLLPLGQLQVQTGKLSPMSLDVNPLYGNADTSTAQDVPESDEKPPPLPPQQQQQQQQPQKQQLAVQSAPTSGRTSPVPPPKPAKKKKSNPDSQPPPIPVKQTPPTQRHSSATTAGAVQAQHARDRLSTGSLPRHSGNWSQANSSRNSLTDVHVHVAAGSPSGSPLPPRLPPKGPGQTPSPTTNTSAFHPMQQPLPQQQQTPPHHLQQQQAQFHTLVGGGAGNGIAGGLPPQQRSAFQAAHGQPQPVFLVRPQHGTMSPVAGAAPMGTIPGHLAGVQRPILVQSGSSHALFVHQRGHPSNQSGGGGSMDGGSKDCDDEYTPMNLNRQPSNPSGDDEICEDDYTPMQPPSHNPAARQAQQAQQQGTALQHQQAARERQQQAMALRQELQMESSQMNVRGARTGGLSKHPSALSMQPTAAGVAMVPVSTTTGMRQVAVATGAGGVPHQQFAMYRQHSVDTMDPARHAGLARQSSIPHGAMANQFQPVSGGSVMISPQQAYQLQQQQQQQQLLQQQQQQQMLQQQQQAMQAMHRPALAGDQSPQFTSPSGTLRHGSISSGSAAGKFLKRQMSGEDLVGTGIAMRRLSEVQSHSVTPQQQQQQQQQLSDGTLLPVGWQAHVSAEGRPYYYNRSLGSTTWSLDDVFRSASASAGSASSTASSSTESAPDTTSTAAGGQAMPESPTREPGAGWKATKNTQGRTYYYNRETRQTTWKIEDTFAGGQ